ncbi:hypothetical protein [Streptomyces sp. ME19-01-6]|uniref:hypothetical protein n=1 Tax=Streptomyces sp. ME19-01-6 TaxID=3028686 RepID=UPI0029AD19EE|nr:hypothetical protein [Streptomyces sp. ME19-01-6]MDX3228834.1 hypothetical protein [Streptomyces sp. ME19-01-6]
MNDESASDHAYAPARSLKGLLHRGRGLGALLAPEDPATSAELVYDAVRQDWRWGTGILVLAEHGEAQDLPALIDELAAHAQARQWCGPDRLAAGLARFGPAAAEAAPVLRRLWLCTPHSCERPAYLKALAAIAPTGLDRAYTESLRAAARDRLATTS